jgi:hypothetical protein
MLSFVAASAKEPDVSGPAVIRVMRVGGLGSADLAWPTNDDAALDGGSKGRMGPGC